MKALKDYIDEGLLSRKISIKAPIKYTPSSTLQLKTTIIDLLRKGQTNLNCIDVFNITDMSYLFGGIKDRFNIQIKDIDISEWDVSNVTSMISMFYDCTEFNADLSNWDVSNVKEMSSMFYGCEKFNSDLSKWDVSNVSKVAGKLWMFSGCDTLEKNNKIPDWYKDSL